jgi:CxxC motif-containing protein (DUF1111 family)
MRENILIRTRRRIGYALTAVLGGGLIWLFTPGLPMLWEPRASAEEKATGQALFEHAWEPHDSLAGGDGLGPVFNARSCVECHFQGGVGGGGGNKHNVLAFEAHPTRDRPEVRGGLIHAFAVENRFLEQPDALRRLFPVVPGGSKVVGGCQILTRDFDPVRTQSVNSSALFGAGWIDRISSKSITHNGMKASVAAIARELDSNFGGIVPGRWRVLADGRIGKFGWKAQFATLEEFVAAACANEIGLGNPRMEQAKPIADCVYPAVNPDLNGKQFRSLVAFVDTLPRPREIVRSSAGQRDRAVRGNELFRSIGCAVCHTPDIGGVSGVYSDFLLHRLEDRRDGSGPYGTSEVPEVPLPEEHPFPDEWKTPPLWGVADSAPYFHDGASLTLRDAITRHQGGAAKVTETFEHLTRSDQDAILAFLMTLRAPADAKPVEPAKQGETMLAGK